MPFDNFSRDPSEQYFVDGLTETLTTHLAQIRSIRVIARTSAMQFAGERKPPIPEVAGVLGVDAVVDEEWPFCSTCTWPCRTSVPVPGDPPPAATTGSP